MDKGQVVLLTHLDLSAAFDTVDHTLLISRLTKSFGIEGNAIKWITSYLTGRSQFVSLKGAKSNSTILECCVPQGSLLGPGFYSDYTSPLGNLLRILMLLFHFYAPNNQNEQVQAAKTLESNIGQISKWMHDNKLKLNSDKTEFLVIGLKKQRNKVIINSLNLEGEIIHSVKSVRNLGVYTDNQLDLKDHVSHVTKICYQQI